MELSESSEEVCGAGTPPVMHWTVGADGHLLCRWQADIPADPREGDSALFGRVEAVPTWFSIAS